MNLIWVLLITVSVVFSVVNGRTAEFTASVFEAAKAAVEVSLFLLGIVSLWLGVTKILEDSGLIFSLSRFFKPAVSRLFRSVPQGHSSVTSITLNLLANLFGLGNAATPLGIKAMQDLQELSGDKETVSDDMMTFIVLNTASIQLVPFTLIGLLAQFGSSNPAGIVFPVLVSTALSALCALGVLALFRKVYK